ncbi:hypothetical protein BJN34_04930 [Cupriavidus necator]|uniref:Uncharacterized protein n=1 Tax=Cupriavidus necator TaxID=106590 RepID=A0A1U9UKX4_CUPNE|nr:hypothetical protein [Cupriavidus necator]AQV93240.1 hypothetical protein BJN34_04930 [Cupriavidus necator]
MLKKALLLTVAGAALCAGAAYAGPTGPREPYTDGGKAATFDVYSGGARIASVGTERMVEASPELLAVARPKDCDPYCGGERQVGGGEIT